MRVQEAERIYEVIRLDIHFMYYSDLKCMRDNEPEPEPLAG